MDNIVKKSVADVFGIEDPAFKNTVVKVFPATPDTPENIKDFVFRSDVLRRLMVWAASVSLPAGFFGATMKRNLMIYGPTGCGKTALAQVFCARTGRSLIRAQCSEDTEPSSLFGTWRLCRPILKEDPSEEAGLIEKGVAGIARAIEKLAIAVKKTTGVGPEMTWVDGPVLRWARMPNSVLLLDEFDQLPPSVAMSLNAVLDGDDILVPETGERVKPAPGNLLAATANTNGRGSAGGNGGSASLYKGAKRQNVATMDRFFVIHTSYLSEAEERQLLMKQTRVNEAVSTAMATLASKIRTQFLGINEDAGAAGTPLEFTITTRNLLNWAMSYTLMVSTGMQSKLALKEALRMTLLDFATPDERKAVEDTWESVVGANA
ncbi:AAA family ATPase [Rubrivivax gelatinosus]|uniref:AAA family ATPase n=1 Tax=Rubrivivax gelatinosus TaxID=28068 RepID=UPI0002D87084|nr:MoxR family ATPase [Rubrivivax gelatinosus]MBG6082976.1 cobaltochelatase CobS [Rubrivivax gelatinosus]